MADYVVARSTIAGYGVFTLQPLRKGRVLFKYGGRVVLAHEDPPDTRYIFYNAHRGVYLDARQDHGNYLVPVGFDHSIPPRAMYKYVNVDPGNRDHPTIAKFVNHLPSALANCRISAGGNVVAKRRIEIGEEITFTYGRSIAFAHSMEGAPLTLG